MARIEAPPGPSQCQQNGGFSLSSELKKEKKASVFDHLPDFGTQIRWILQYIDSIWIFQFMDIYGCTFHFMP